MAKLTLFFVVSIIVEFANAQITFQKTYGGAYEDHGDYVQQTFDGGYIIVGTLGNSIGAGVYLIKTDSIGDTTWTKTFNDIGSGYGIQQTSDSGYIVIGTTSSLGAGSADFYLLKTDANGYMLWNKTYGGTSQDRGFSVKQTFDGGYILTGQAWYLGGFSNSNIYLLKTDANGDTLWTKIIVGQIMVAASSIEQTSDSAFVLAGIGYSFLTNSLDVFLSKVSSNGTVMWLKSYGGSGQDEGLSVQQTFDGGFIVSSTAYSFGGGGYKVYVIKTDSTGNLIWSKTFEGIGGSGAPSVQQTNDSGYIVAGFLDCPVGDRNVYLIKINVIGDTIWTRTFGASSSDWAASVKQTTDGGYIIVGTTYSFEPNGEVYLIKTDSNGNSSCNQNRCSVVVSNPPTQIGNPSIVVASGGIVTTPFVSTGSGGIVTNLCYSTGIGSEISFPYEKITIYPNPSNGEFTIIGGEVNYLQIIIYNLFGNVIYSEEMKHLSSNISKQINLQVPSGIYLTKLFDGEKNYCKKLIIE